MLHFRTRVLHFRTAVVNFRTRVLGFRLAVLKIRIGVLDFRTAEVINTQTPEIADLKSKLQKQQAKK